MNDDDISKFTCKECGGHSLIVTHVWTIMAGSDSGQWQEWGPLKDNHHWHYEFSEKIDGDADDENQTDAIGEDEESDSASEPEEYEIYEPETNRESDEFFVNCGNCDREIEFGWSQADRRGLIWPVDFSDFDPSESWPDPKYTKTWRQKGWLQMGNIQP